MGSPRVLVDRYTLVRQLGAGAQGTVWLARDEKLRREVAVKQVSRTDERFGEAAEIARQRAMREGRIAARLSHPNAVSVYDVAVHDGDPWLVMEYVPSRTLTEVVRDQGGIPPRQAAALGAQLAGALAEAHRLGIVHRDVKPSNVLLTTDGRAKITDFGIARGNDDATLTATGLVTGTPAYFAPELARGVTGPTPATDVWSLGATLYYAVEGMPPFGTHENPLVLLGRIASQEVQVPVRAGDLEHVLLRMLARDPAMRPTMTQARAMLTTIAGEISNVPVLIAEPNTEENDRVPDDSVPDSTAVDEAVPVVGAQDAAAQDETAQDETAQDEIAQDDADRDDADQDKADQDEAEPDEAAPDVAVTAGAADEAGPDASPPTAAVAGAWAADEAGEPDPAWDRDLGPAPEYEPVAASAGEPLPAPPPPRDPAQDRRRTRGIVLIAACAIVLSLAGLGSYLLLGDRERDLATAPGPTTSAPKASPQRSSPPASASPSPTATPEPTPEETTPTPTPTPPGSPMQAGAMEAFVTDYYAMLPREYETAWNRLGPSLRSQGFGSYERWWTSVSSASVTNLEADPDSGTVTGTVRFVMNSGRSSTERHRFGMTETADGKGLLINTDRVL